MSEEKEKTKALDLDRKDPLKDLRQEFIFPSSGGGGQRGSKCLYFCGHSLGLQPKRAREYVEQEMQDWAHWGVGGHQFAHNPWVSYHELLTESMARLVGAWPEEVVVMNTLTVNLHLAMVSFYRPTRKRFKILIENSTFPSDRYAVCSQARFHGFDPEEAVVELTPSPGKITVEGDEILQTVEQLGDSLALVMLGNCNYLSGQAFDMEAITRKAHRVGALAGFNLAHGAGNLHLHLHDWKVDFAVWCSYKYLNSGPGGLAGFFVHRDHLGKKGKALPRFEGWWGQNKGIRFDMGQNFDPIPTAEAWQLSNPPILPLASLRASMELFDRAGMSALRKKGDLLTAYLQSSLERHCSDVIQIITPQAPRERGSMLSLRLSMSSGFDPVVIQRSFFEKGIFCDVRSPDILRITPAPLYNSFEDVYHLVEAIRELSHARQRSSSSSSRNAKGLVIVGGGLVGSLLALMLRQRGHEVELFEKRPDRRGGKSGGRSINLVVTSRGLHALKSVDLHREVLDLAVPVKGRMIHSREGDLVFQPYGRNDSECNYSISRAQLNDLLLDRASEAGVRIHFGHRLKTLEVEGGGGPGGPSSSLLLFETPQGDTPLSVRAQRVFGADGASSAVRKALPLKTRVNPLGASYVELFIPPQKNGGYAMEKNALHIWPRQTHMLMALANLDGSFTMTLYLPDKPLAKGGSGVSFETVTSREDVQALFKRDFADAFPLMPRYREDFIDNPVGRLGTVHCHSWAYGEKVVLVGDAAHAIVPFLGQGMNAGFEDCTCLQSLIGQRGMEEWDEVGVFHQYDALQRPNGLAVAEMAIENYREMQDRVGDSRFLLKKKLEQRLQAAFPHKYRTRYALITYTLIPYRHAQNIGEIQKEIVEELAQGQGMEEELDLDLNLDLAKAEQLIDHHLVPYLQTHRIELI